METRQAVMIDSASGLDELYDTITQYYELDKNAAEWGRHRRNFIKSLPGKDWFVFEFTNVWQTKKKTALQITVTLFRWGLKRTP